MPEPMRCSLNVTFHYWGLPLEAALDGAVTAGFRTIELLDPYSVGLDQLEAALQRRGLSVDVFNLPMGDFYAGDRGFAGDPARRDEFREGVESALLVAERLGTARVNALSGALVEGESESAQLRCLVDQLGWAADRLATVGVQLATELLNPFETPGYLLSSIDRVRETLGQLDGRVGFQCDVYHLGRCGYDLVPTIVAMAPLTSHYQIADTPARTEPGSGDTDFPAVFAAIAASGYDQIVGCEFRPSSPDVDAFAWMETFGVVRA